MEGLARPDVTRLLRSWSRGEPEVADELFHRIYGRLKRIAGALASDAAPDPAGHDLHATALVHEAFLRLRTQRRVHWNDRDHFFSVAARIMRRLLVDAARARNAGRRGGGRVRVTLSDLPAGSASRSPDLLCLDQALSRLEALDRRVVQVVEMRYFAGMTLDEIARALGCSAATVSRDQKTAKAWLRRELAGGGARREP